MHTPIGADDKADFDLGIPIGCVQQRIGSCQSLRKLGGFAAGMNHRLRQGGKLGVVDGALQSWCSRPASDAVAMLG